MREFVKKVGEIESGEVREKLERHGESERDIEQVGEVGRKLERQRESEKVGER